MTFTLSATPSMTRADGPENPRSQARCHRARHANDGRQPSLPLATPLLLVICRVKEVLAGTEPVPLNPVVPAVLTRVSSARVAVASGVYVWSLSWLGSLVKYFADASGRGRVPGVPVPALG
jgi:hypothetical protein